MNSQHLRLLSRSGLTQLFLIVFVCLIPFALTAAEVSSSQPPVEQQLPENYSESQVDTIMAGLDDTQVRQMLINELKKDARQEAVPEAKKGRWLGAKLAMVELTE